MRLYSAALCSLSALLELLRLLVSATKDLAFPTVLSTDCQTVGLLVVLVVCMQTLHDQLPFFRNCCSACTINPISLLSLLFKLAELGVRTRLASPGSLRLAIICVRVVERQVCSKVGRVPTLHVVLQSETFPRLPSARFHIAVVLRVVLQRYGLIRPLLV